MVEIVYTDGNVTTNLTVLAADATDTGKPDEAPEPGDNGNTALFIGLLSIPA